MLDPEGSSAEIDADDAVLGAKLRAVRKRSGITLQDLATRTALSTGTLSNIERGINSPSLRTLRAICQAMDIDGAELFGVGSEQVDDTFGMVVRRSSRNRLNFRDQHVIKYRITPPTCEAMEAYLLQLDKNGGSGPEFYASNGEKIFFVLSGRFEVEIEGKSVLLYEGDSFGCRRKVLHRWRNGWDKPTTVLLTNNSHFYV